MIKLKREITVITISNHQPKRKKKRISKNNYLSYLRLFVNHSISPYPSLYYLQIIS